MSAELDPALKAAAAYNAAADHFDDEPLGFWMHYGRQTVDRLSIPKGAAVLDVGCGTGASALPAAERVGTTGSVIGVDIAERLIQIAREKAAARHLHNVTFRVCDMRQTGYPDAAFDVVISVFSIFFVPDMTAQVRELWRLVRPGGTLAITSWGPRMFEPASTGWRASIREIRPDLHSEFNPWDRITEPAALQSLLAEGGVRSAHIAAEAGEYPLRTPEDWWTVILGSGYRWVVEQLTQGELERIRQANLDWIRTQQISSIETNVLFATATK